MLRPERMSKVSVAGSRMVMPDVIEAIHELNLVHLSDYDGSWEGFDPGNPVTGADEASDKLVTVRSIESILEVSGEDAGPQRIVTGEALEEELEEIRAQVNRLDARRNELEAELQSVEERIDAMKPFATLGIDLDLLSGYDHLQVAVGEGDANEIERALAESSDVQEYELFSEERTVAVFVYPEDGAEDALGEALVGIEFTTYDVPEASGSPEEYVAELEHDYQKHESKLNGVESELNDVKLDAAGFLLAAEEKLAIEVQKEEAPLQFATTENAFIAEGWIPSDRYDDLVTAIRSAVGDRADVDELERAAYRNPTEEHHVAMDGGTEENPPVVQDNPDPTRPFELLVETINRPRYFEIDPTIVLFLTLPIFFGFMIGDVGYGLIYLTVGWYLFTRFDGGFKSLGGIALWSGGVTIVFGIIFAEFFGFHFAHALYGAGGPPMEKGLTPSAVEWAYLWLVMSILVGLLHINVGFIFDFREKLDHGIKHAFMEAGSWILLMNGLWLWILSTSTKGSKPEFLFTVFNGEPVPLGFTGFSPETGMVGLAIALVGMIALVVSEGLIIALVDGLEVVTHVLSYARLTAEIIAEAGIALVVNLLVFGASFDGESYHYLIDTAPSAVSHGEVVFPGLFHMGIIGVLFGIVLLILGHLVVLALGIVSAGLQALRLEYVEFFGKFYEGGGEKFQPFGYDRSYTTED
ncbi:V-type ATP synthase subunit I [Haladaptatus sp. R4]|uniref:V-type ATP synthase subunit I n=1 Tax=Haladaptatus sp. R4 TaxID=1679489 RepID=UPI0007B491C3|nr:V-type ATP synthase subunit I [Haladaptatus sp. R4]KZN25154.1 V-type ATP synthase subunit I [Haladaptatus sp. R4]